MSQIYEASGDEMDVIKDSCERSKVQPMKIRGVLQFKKVTWSFLVKGGWFPTGWLTEVNRKLKQAGYSVGVIDRRTPPKGDGLEGDFPFELRPYQQETVDIMKLKERGIIKAPTGCGKSNVAYKLIDELSIPTLFLVPKLNLLSQTYKSMCEIFEEGLVGKIGGGDFQPSFITVSTAATLWSRKDTDEVKDFLKSINLLILDEVHHTGTSNGSVWKNRKGKSNPTRGNTYYQVAMKCENAYYRFGMTATPKKGDARDLLTCVTGEIIQDISYESLRDAGYLSDVIVSIYDVALNLPKNWREAYYLWMRSETVNRLITKIARHRAKQGKSVLIVIDEIHNHGNVLKDYLPEAVILYGGDKQSDQKLDDFRDKKQLIYISTTIKEGVDIPSLDVIIRACAKKGDVNVVQVAGRSTRKTETKFTGEIVDFYVHGGKTLEKWSQTRLGIYQDEGFQIVQKGMEV